MADYLEVGLFLLAGGLFYAGSLWFASLLRPANPTGAKRAVYECGEVPLQKDAWVRYPAGYYAVALVFLLFDIEAVFLFPWAVALRELGSPAMVEMLVFLLVLTAGLWYAWKRRVLRWI